MEELPMRSREDVAADSVKEPELVDRLRPRPFIRRAAAHPFITAALISLILAVILAIILGTYFGIHDRSSNNVPLSNSSSTSPAPASTGNSTTMPAVATLQASPSALNFPPIQEAFVSFAIEFLFFPDFAGNLSSPNTFSDNLLNNIGNISGTKPYIRVGGNSADLAIYVDTLPTAVSAVSEHDGWLPRDIKIGPSFFESYSSWPGTKFIHGLNLKNATTSEVGWQSLLDVVPVACKALGDGKLLLWEYGNEPDLYPRPHSQWNDTTYVNDWQNGTVAIQNALANPCPEMASGDAYGYVGPSLSGTTTLPPVGLFQDGLNDNGLIRQYTTHHYVEDAGLHVVSLQNNLMNHTANTASLMGIITQTSNLNHPALINPTDTQAPIPFTLDETNSVVNGPSGPPNLLNVFGAALWTVDYMLMCASIGLSRIHMQQGTGFLYNSWQPVSTNTTRIETSPPYYGNVAVAAMLGDITTAVPRVVNVPLPGAGDFASAYACYINGNTLARVAVVDLYEYNTTIESVHPSGAITRTPNTAQRPSNNYTFRIPSELQVADGKQVGVQRLLANGSDVRDGITWDGWSYAYELDNGRPVKLMNITTGETVVVKEGEVTVSLVESSAVILNFV